MRHSYTVTHPIHRDNVMYPMGGSIILDEASAHRLKHCIDLTTKKVVEDQVGFDAGLELLQGENKRLEGLLTDANENLNVANSTIEQLNATLANRESDLDELIAERAQLKKTAEETAKLLAEASEKLAERDKTIADLNSRIAELGKAPGKKK